MKKNEEFERDRDHMKRNHWTFVLVMVSVANGSLCLPLGLESLHAATVPDIRGTWQDGPRNLSRIGCQEPTNNGVFFVPGVGGYVITNQSGANFSFTRDLFLENNRETQTCSGTVSSDGSVRTLCTFEESQDGEVFASGTMTFTGSLVGNTLAYTTSGQVLVGETCQWTETTKSDTRIDPVPPPLVLPITTPYDLNGDGKADLVWRNTSSRVVAAWLMNGTTIEAMGFPAGVPDNWQIEGIGDVNGDGKADVFWQNVFGPLAVWLMNGLTIASVGYFGRTDIHWIMEGVGDLNGDGKADVIRRYHHPVFSPSSGQVVVWLMDGTTISFSAFLGGVPLDWKLVGVGDVNEDGKADVIWWNSVSGAVTVWLMNGTTIASMGLVGGTSTDWKVQGVGDVDGDGKVDLIWQNENSHVVAVWFMNGTTIASTAFLPGVPSEWKIEQVADVNGDGKFDVIWQHTNGTVAVWLMNGPTIASVGFPGSVPSEWEIQPLPPLDRWICCVFPPIP